MNKARILTVEDESIVALDIEMLLTSLGYESAGYVSSGEDAIRFCSRKLPDLVLMDIHLKGEMDGIEAAGYLVENYGLPIIYLTAYSDKETLDRAKISQPFAYIIKPLQERELHSNIEMALYRHAIEFELKKKDVLLEATLSSVNDGILTVDTRGCVLYQNPAAEKILGHVSSSRELEVQIENRIHADLDRTLTVIKKTGLPVELFRRSLDELEIIIIRDISFIVENEARLIQRSRTAEEVSQAKTGFIANMSHELRTPLNSIMGMTDIVLENIDDTDMREYLMISRHASEGLLSLINSILDYSKLEAGKMDLHRVPFDPDETLENALQKIALDAYKKGLDIRSDIYRPLSCLYSGDPGRFFQIFLNLLSNAVKYTERGFIGISRSIDADYDDHTDFRITVSDSGVGIKDESRDSIFEAFTQQDSSYTRKNGGTGLGLTIVRDLVVMMGGTIAVQSIPGKGSHFTVSLSLDKAQKKDTVALSLVSIVNTVIENRNLDIFLGNILRSLDIQHKKPDIPGGVSMDGEKTFVELTPRNFRKLRQFFSDNSSLSEGIILLVKLGDSRLRKVKELWPDTVILFYPFRYADFLSCLSVTPRTGQKGKIPVFRKNIEYMNTGKNLAQEEDGSYNDNAFESKSRGCPVTTVDTLQDYFSQLEDAIAADDYSLISAIAGELKNSAEHCCNRKLEILCFKLVLAARNKDRKKTYMLINKLAESEGGT